MTDRRTETDAADRKPDLIRPTDAEARDLARGLVATARTGALAVTDPASGHPFVTRVAVGHDGGVPLILVSMLALHTRALLADPACALLLGEPGPKGDPMNQPRLTWISRAEPVDKTAHRDAWLAGHPKTRLYYDFPDFRMFRLSPVEGHLNGGFGRAFRLTPGDLVAG